MSPVFASKKGKFASDLNAERISEAFFRKMQKQWLRYVVMPTFFTGNISFTDQITLNADDRSSLAASLDHT